MRVSRREFTVALAAALPASVFPAEATKKGTTFPSAAARYFDPATEFPIVRLTDPQYSSLIPASNNRVLTSRAILYASDQTGRWEAFRMDMKSRESKQLTEAAALDVSSLAFTPGDKGFWHFDGERLTETNFGGLKARELYRVPEGFVKTPGISYSNDGQHAAFVERGGAYYRLRVIHLQKGTAATILEGPSEIRDVAIRPKRPSLFYRTGEEARLIHLDGQQSRLLSLAPGELGQAQWSADGRILLYLNRPSANRPIGLREFEADAGSGSPHHGLIAETTQFARFSSNADASVFVGTSGSKASPYVLLLVRAARRELTLAEHRSSEASNTVPLFAPNSQFVVFGSDRHGKPALYWIAVDKFVSDTGGS